MNLENAIKSSKFKNAKHKAVLNVLYTAWWLKTIMSKELKEFGLTHEQYNVLRILKGKHPGQMCVRDIGCRMIEKNSNVPRIIDKLEIKKYVTRSVSSDDRRETAIALTDEGLTILETSTKATSALLEEMVDFTEEQASTLNELLEELRQNE